MLPGMQRSVIWDLASGIWDLDSLMRRGVVWRGSAAWLAWCLGFSLFANDKWRGLFAHPGSCRRRHPAITIGFYYLI